MTFNPTLPHITPNFALHEFQCMGMFCCDHTAAINHQVVLNLQKMRDIIARPIKINSGFRCKKHNYESGGRTNSAHIYGLAADIAFPDGILEDDLMHIVADCGFTFILPYTWGLHLDIMER